MVPRRISIAGLMGLVGVVAVGLVSLKQANELWASVWLTAMLLILGVGLLNAGFGRRRSRAFWGGFSLAVGFYLIGAYGLLSRADRPGPAPLLTDYVIVRIQDRMHPSVESISFSSSTVYLAPSGSMGVVSSRSATQSLPTIRNPFVLAASSVPEASFEQVGQCLWTLLIALGGGFYAARLAAIRETSKVPADSSITPSSP